MTERTIKQLALLFPYMTTAERKIATTFYEDKDEDKLTLFIDMIWRMI